MQYSVLGNSRNFAAVFERAQQILRSTFGMEMVELHRGVEDDGEETKGTGLKKKGA
jgi:hypothetical protein